MKIKDWKPGKPSITAIIALATLLLAHLGAYAAISLTTEHLDKTLYAVQKHYLDPGRIDPDKMLRGSLDNLQMSVPEIMVSYHGSGSLTLTVGHAQKKFQYGTMTNLAELQSTMHELFRFIAANYTGDMDVEDIEAELINGICDSLDPHSNFLSKKVYDEFKVGTTGKFGGIGIVISIRDGFLTVIAPIEGTPAYRAGVKAGERIIQINDESTINMSLTDAVNKLRGDPGTDVIVMLESEGRPSRKATLTRAIIKVESVKHALLMEGNKRIGYIGVKSFQTNTYKDVKNALAALNGKGTKMDGLILDMRNNPGGLLSSAVKISDLFLKGGTIVSTVGRGEIVMDSDMANISGTEPDYPIIALINEGSASASEIVAGALQTNGRAVVVGMESFGKGSVQTIIETGDDTALKITIARYLPAGKVSIQLEGVVPDIDLLPVVIDKDQINLFRDTTFSEADLEEHLGKSENGKKSNGPVFVLRYLQPKAEEEDIDEISRREYSKKPVLDDDFAVEISKKLLAFAGRGARKAMLEASKGTIAEAEKQENVKIDKALSKLGVDWQKIPADGKPKIRLASAIYMGGKRVGKAKAGEKMELQLMATNIGKGNYSQLMAIGQSKNSPFLADREFPFGALKPGQTKKWTVPIELPQSLATQDLVMNVEFEEGNDNAPKKTEVVIPTKGLPKPVFAVEYEIPSKYMGKAFKPNQSIPFEVTLTNMGKGISSEDTTAALSDECDDRIFIEKGRFKFGKIKPGEKKTEKFRFHMLSGYNSSKCQMNFLVADLKLGTGFSKKIDLNASAGILKPATGTKLIPPKITINEYPLMTKKKRLKISGTIEDDDKIFDYYAFVGEDKVAYKTNPGDLTKIVFDFDVELKEGANRIMIVARDSEKIAKSEGIVIYRTKN